MLMPLPAPSVEMMLDVTELVDEADVELVVELAMTCRTTLAEAN
jgi:hypothetical protein